MRRLRKNFFYCLFWKNVTDNLPITININKFVFLLDPNLLVMLTYVLKLN